MGDAMAGVLLALLSSAGFGLSAVFVRLGLISIRPIVGTAISLMASVILVILVAFAFETEALLRVSLAAVLWFCFVGFVNFALGRCFNYIGVRYVGAARASALRAMHPLFAVIFAVIFLREGVSFPMLLGVVLIVGGVALVAKEKLE